MLWQDKYTFEARTEANSIWLQWVEKLGLHTCAARNQGNTIMATNCHFVQKAFTSSRVIRQEGRNAPYMVGTNAIAFSAVSDSVTIRLTRLRQ